jgi:putative DNA primase/helicase
MQEEDEIEAALSHIPAEDRDTWVAVGMAIKSGLNGQGFDLWDQWSQTACNYESRAAKAVWRSIRPYGRTTIRTVFHLARENGWNGQHTERKRDPAEEKKRAEVARREADLDARKQARAATEAAKILKLTRPAEHAYLISKGFQCGPVVQGWQVEHLWKNIEIKGPQLVSPLYREGKLIGAELISETGGKAFLPGQKNTGAEFVIGKAPLHVWCEGLATGLSIQAAMKKIQPCTIHICFSAHNLGVMAKTGIVIADNDAINPRTGKSAGQEAAKKTGLPYWLSPLEKDFNDFHLRVGLFKASQALLPFVNQFNRNSHGSI